MRFSLVLLAALVFSAANFAAEKKPNVLFIAIDDQNDWIGYLGGHPMVKTPHIDRLAKRGTAFTNAHCQAPLCNPSRTSLMTGLRPSTTGIYGLSPWFRTVPELKNLVTLPQYLKQQGGYKTYSTGKIYHGRYGRQNNDQEFDLIGPGASAMPFPPKKLIGSTPFGNHKLMDWGVFDHKDEDKGDWKVASWAVDQLDTKPKEPFFMSVGFFLPHVPCFATQKWFDLYPDDDSVLPKILRNDRADTPRFSWYMHWYLPEVRHKWLEENNQWRNLVRSYLACTSFVDSQVGRLINALKRNNFNDNTVIVLWSDHGWHLGEKAISGKNTLWDDGTRVPLIFAGPGVKPGQICTQPAELLDIYPTLNKLLDLPKKNGLDGRSLTPQLKNAKTKRKWPAITTHNHDNHGVRSENWRYIQYADGSEELYDMRKDPNEWNNLANNPKHAKVIARHKKFLPKKNRKPAPNSKHRILLYKNGKANWQGTDIDPTTPIPGIED
ncbi:MAG: sulfatase [Verrucomicrobiota bacterium]|nr:sulfatase [Verrucomicrobiota bacterium]